MLHIVPMPTELLAMHWYVRPLSSILILNKLVFSLSSWSDSNGWISVSFSIFTDHSKSIWNNNNICQRTNELREACAKHTCPGFPSPIQTNVSSSWIVRRWITQSGLSVRKKKQKEFVFFYVNQKHVSSLALISAYMKCWHSFEPLVYHAYFVIHIHKCRHLCASFYYTNAN